MATFELTAPDGGVYHVDAPDEHSAVTALGQLRKPAAPQRVTDPAILAQLNAPANPPPRRTLNIGGRNVSVDDSFFRLSPDEQNATVDEIAKSLPPSRIKAPDGSIVEFPAGMSDDEINAAMKKAYDAGTFGKPAQRVTDPAILAQLNAPTEPRSALQSIREAIHAPTRALENGAFLGLGDRVRAIIDAALSGTKEAVTSGSVAPLARDYSKHLADERAETEAFQQAHPIASPALNAAGGVIAPLAVLKATAAPATLGGKTLAGMGAGGGVGAVQGALESKDYTDPLQVAKDAATGGVVGAGLGILVPNAAKVVGAGYNTLANAVRGRVDGMSRGASSHLISAVQADTPAAVQQRLQELGPDAMLADAGPALLGKAQGASLNSDEARSTLQNALTARNEATNARIQSDVNGALGPAEDPQTVSNAITAHRSAVDAVNYPAALDNAPPVRTAHILTQLDYLIPRSVGDERKALTTLRGMVMTTERRPLVDAAGLQQYDRLGNPMFQDVPVSQNNAEVLHKVKQELDKVIEYDAPGLGVPAGALSRQQAALKDMRFQVNDALEQQVPGYANANAVSAALAKRAEAVQNGTQYLGSGKTTASPDRFAAEFDPLSQGEKIAFAKGSRGNIERVLGTKANDLEALRSELQGEGGWNTAKLATVHGDDAANELVNSVNRNRKFRDTFNKVVENSQTAQRTAAAKEMKPDPSTETALINPNMSLTGLVGTGAKKGLTAVVNALTKSDPTRHYGEVARALTEQGAARDARLAAVIDALDRRQANAAGAQTAGNLGSVVAALLGEGAVRPGPAQRPAELLYR